VSPFSKSTVEPAGSSTGTPMKAGPEKKKPTNNGRITARKQIHFFDRKQYLSIQYDVLALFGDL
jgi:hypothetical protein